MWLMIKHHGVEIIDIIIDMSANNTIGITFTLEMIVFNMDVLTDIKIYP